MKVSLFLIPVLGLLLTACGAGNSAPTATLPASPAQPKPQAKLLPIAVLLGTAADL